MTTHVSTTNPVRSDVLEHRPEVVASSRAAARPSRAWAVAGIASAVAGIGTIVTSSMVSTVYDEGFAGTTDGVAAALQDKAGVMFAFHSITVVGALLMVVYAAGLFRRLRQSLPEGSTIPLVAFAGLVGTAVVSILGSGLDTEFMMPLAQGDGLVDDATGAMYNHWIGTIPWLWTLAGLAGVAVFAAARRGAVPRWIGRVSLVLGGLTLVLGTSPLEYMSGVTGALWLLVTAIGFAVGDKAHRAAAAR
jgi:hypothetical protein